MGVLFAEDFEGGTNGANVTTGNTAFGGIGSPTPTFSNAEVLTGSLSMRTTGAGGGNASPLPDWNAAPTKYFRAYIYVSAFVASGSRQIMSATTSTGRPRIYLNSSGYIEARLTSTLQATATAPLALGWNRVEHRITGTTSHQVRVFAGANLHGTTPDWDSGSLGSGGNSNDNSYRFGNGASGQPDMWWDALAIRDDDWVGPIPPPVPAFTPTVDGLDVDFDATASTSPNGAITAYAWDFGDSNTGSGATTSHTYAAPGTYDVELTVTDALGMTASLTQQVVADDPTPPGPPPVVGYSARHVPLSVVLETVDGPEVITSRVSNLVVKNSSPGGFASVEFDLPRRLDQSRLPGRAQVLVYDSVTGEQVGGGRLVEQGPSDDGTWKMAALGEGIAALGDIDEPYMVIDAVFDSITLPEVIGHKTKMVGSKRKRRKNSGQGFLARSRRRKVLTGIAFADAKVASAPNDSASDNEGLLFQVPSGISVASGATCRAIMEGPSRTGQKLGAYAYRVISGKTTSAWSTHGIAQTMATGSTETDRAENWSTSLGAQTWKVHTTDFLASRDAVQIRIVAGSSHTTDTLTWSHIRELIIRSQLHDRNGNVRSGADHQAASVGLASVFTDLIVTRCPSLKVGNVASTTFAFRQLAWYDGATAAEILDEMMAADSDHAWHAWERDADGKTPIHLDPIPTTVRYELDVKDGYSAPTPSSEIYDRVVVTGKDAMGFERVEIVDRNTDGFPRSTTMRMTGNFDGVDAIAAGNLFLDQHAAPPNAGTITVARPVLDLWTGRWVRPYAIRSGHLCRVRGVQPTPDTLNPEAKQDGVTIFRIVSNTFSESTGTSSLELDTNVVDTDRAIADLLG